MTSQSSHKAELETLPNSVLIERIRLAMDEGCIRPVHIYDAVDIVLDRLQNIDKIIASINLPKCLPRPWQCTVYVPDEEFSHTGYCEILDARGHYVTSVNFESPNYIAVEKSDGKYDAGTLAFCECVNAVDSIKKLIPSPTESENSSVSGVVRDALEFLDKVLFIGVDGCVHGLPDKTKEIETTLKSALAKIRNHQTKTNK